MFKKQKKTVLNSKIIKLLFFSPMLFLTPFFSSYGDLKAGLEFQWDSNPNYIQLKWFQKDEDRRARNKIFFFLRPRDRKNGLLKVNLKMPKTFKSNLNEENISLCKVLIGGFEKRTKCLDNIPADVEISDDKKSIDIFPYSPIPSNKDSYAIVFKVFNPNKSGMYQFHSFGQYIGKNPVLSYLGSWTIRID